MLPVCADIFGDHSELDKTSRTIDGSNGDRVVFGHYFKIGFAFCPTIDQGLGGHADLDSEKSSEKSLSHERYPDLFDTRSSRTRESLVVAAAQLAMADHAEGRRKMGG